MSNSDDNRQRQPRASGLGLDGTVGLLVFVVGIVMIVVVFWLGYQLFANIDNQIAQVRTVAAVTAPPSDTDSETPAERTPETVVAQPRPDSSLAQVAATIGLKLLGLVVLAYIGGLVATKGVQLAHGLQRGF